VNIKDAYADLYLLSQKALGTTSPNPNVAAAIYGADGSFIADGFHNRLISPEHAEVVALKKAQGAARGATIVVSLEPCSHTGDTPPCTDAIIEAGIARVIYAVKDPNPIAAGGADKLVAAGIAAEYLASPELEFIQRAWLHKVATGRPLMIWKVATSIDSKVAASDGSSQWISNEFSRADVQLLRSQSDAILIGTQTALSDNPHLIPRGHANRPVRIVCGERSVPATHQIFDDQAPTISVASRSLPDLMKVLMDGGFNQVFIEAGPTLGTALLRAGMIDELIHYQAPILLGRGRDFTGDLGITRLKEKMEFELLSLENMHGDIKSHYAIKRGN